MGNTEQPRKDWEEFKSWPFGQKVLAVLFVLVLALATSIQ